MNKLKRNTMTYLLIKGLSVFAIILTGGALLGFCLGRKSKKKTVEFVEVDAVEELTE